MPRCSTRCASEISRALTSPTDHPQANDAMCGIAGSLSLSGRPVPALTSHLDAMSLLVRHRGPDGEGSWVVEGQVHRPGASPPRHHRPVSDAACSRCMAPNGTVITYNGEIYNYVELRAGAAAGWTFRSTSDTEVILAAYERWGDGCVSQAARHVRVRAVGRAPARLFAARDRFGIKPFYYAVVDDRLLLRLRDEGAAAVPAGDCDRPGRAWPST